MLRKICFKLVFTLQNALSSVIDDNKRLRKQLRETDRKLYRILDQIDHVIELDGFSYPEKIEMISTITKGNKMSLDILRIASISRHI